MSLVKKDKFFSSEGLLNHHFRTKKSLFQILLAINIWSLVSADSVMCIMQSFMLNLPEGGSAYTYFFLKLLIEYECLFINRKILGVRIDHDTMNKSNVLWLYTVKPD